MTISTTPDERGRSGAASHEWAVLSPRVQAPYARSSGAPTRGVRHRGGVLLQADQNPPATRWPKGSELRAAMLRIALRAERAIGRGSTLFGEKSLEQGGALRSLPAILVKHPLDLWTTHRPEHLLPGATLSPSKLAWGRTPSDCASHGPEPGRPSRSSSQPGPSKVLVAAHLAPARREHEGP